MNDTISRLKVITIGEAQYLPAELNCVNVIKQRLTSLNNGAEN